MTIPTSKVCTKCGVEKPLESFPRDNRERSGRRSSCAVCNRTRDAAWYVKNKERVIAATAAWRTVNPERRALSSAKTSRRRVASGHKRWNSLKVAGANLAGISPSDLVVPTGCVCEICEADKPGGRGSFHKDHCHTTGKIRGWLCVSCNLNFERLHPEAPLYPAAQAYLLTHAA